MKEFAYSELFGKKMLSMIYPNRFITCDRAYDSEFFSRSEQLHQNLEGSAVNRGVTFSFVFLYS